MTTFLAQVENFRKLTLANLRYVAAESIQDVLVQAQTPQPSVKRTGGTFIEGRIPVDTGALIQSLVSGNGAGGTKGELSYTTAIAGLEIGDVLTFAWTAPYARRIESGFVGTDSAGRTFNQQGRHFVAKAAARFPEFVKARVAEVSK